MLLRPYQQEMLADIRTELRHHRSVCATAPTGSGKTVMFSAMGRGAIERGKRVWFLAHRQELIDQISEKLFEFDVPHGFIKAGVNTTASQAQVGMIRTTKNRLHKLEFPDLLVIDECHHTPAAEYAAILAAMPKATKIVGFTATPERLDGKGLGGHYSSLVCGPSTADLISSGYLVPPTVYAPQLVDVSALHTLGGDFRKDESERLLDKPTITGDAIEHYKRLAGRTSAVVFCTSVAHAIHVAADFRNAGITAGHVDGGMASAERAAVLEHFRTGKVAVLTSADLISEGFDLPRIATAILLRPTRSLGLYLQQVGRALRVEEGKVSAIILDHVGNTMRHGLPDMHRVWSLEGSKRRSRSADPDDLQIKTCSVCFLVFSGRMCPQCKVAELSTGRQIDEREGELVEVSEQRSWLNQTEIDLVLLGEFSSGTFRSYCLEKGIVFAAARDIVIKRAKTLEQLQTVGRALGYKANWAFYRHNAWRRA